MSLSLLVYSPTSQNQRVSGYTIGNDEQPRRYDAELALSDADKSDLIQAAYRQIFHEQQMLESYRQPFLESQLRVNQITVRDFIRGLVTADAFLRLNYQSNNNYRFVQLCIQRILGRDVFGDREKMAWSTVVATQGVHRFVDALLNGEEYEQHFGDSVVPYQRRRMLPQRASGELPFARMARYDQRDRPDLVARTLPDMGDIGKGLFITALSLLIAATLLLVLSGATQYL